MTEQIIIDAEGCVAGRVASFAAKKALQGSKVVIVNSDKAIVSGKTKDILEKYKNKFGKSKGQSKGPYVPRISDRLMRRIVRGMLPWKRTKGREAYKRILCFRGVPAEFKESKKEVIAKTRMINFLTLHDICRLVGKEK